MKSRIGAALLLTASVAAGTLGLAGTASAGPITTPATGSAQVKCENGRGTLVVTAKNNSGQTANLRVRSPYGIERERNVARDATATIEIPTGLSNVPAGRVDVITRVDGVRQSVVPVSYTAKNCANDNRRPQITVVGLDGNNNGRLNRVRVTNDGGQRITVRVVANGQIVTHDIRPGRTQAFVLNDTARFASVIATRSAGNQTYTTFRIVRA